MSDARLSARAHPGGRGSGCRDRSQAETWLSDSAVSHVIGTLMLALITVTMALAYSEFVLTSMPEPTANSDVDLGVKLDPGLGGWGDGDEAVIITHLGGGAVQASVTTLYLQVGSTVTEIDAGSLSGPFDDGRFEIGEVWERTTELPPETSVHVDVVKEGPPGAMLASARLRSGTLTCNTDTASPYVEAWTQDPVDVLNTTTGVITVTATVGDRCSGVDDGITPHLMHLLDDGGDVSFSDAGAMTQVGATTWEGTIPEPTDGWDVHENETLVYRLDPLADNAGNTGTSENRTDHIQAGDAPTGNLTLFSEHHVRVGTFADVTAAQDADDGGAAAVLSEGATSPALESTEAYGSAHSSNGAESPGDATGSPDDVHATLPSDRDWVGVKGFDTFQGSIESVEIALEAHYNGTVNGAEDELHLAYEVAGSEGPTSTKLAISDLSEGSDGPAVYLNVTADRSWTWTDVGNLLVKGEYAKQQSEDAIDFHVDALWVRLVYDDPAYQDTLELNVTGVPSTGSHELELRYNVTEETHEVAVWNHTAAAWSTRSDQLTATAPATWTSALADDEISSTDVVRIRLQDTGPDAQERSELHLDYVGVRTT